MQQKSGNFSELLASLQNNSLPKVKQFDLLKNDFQTYPGNVWGE